ncbi:hypothetical protein V1512DRAFT_255665 [Lipomyces arxii]|uniref:uncharacterized protein n=1 Tax=Lipomyces arxii TaxID=56418 RepID=UPI0034CD0853
MISSIECSRRACLSFTAILKPNSLAPKRFPVNASSILKNIEQRRHFFINRSPNNDDQFIFDFTPDALQQRKNRKSKSRNPLYTWPGFILRFSTVSAVFSGGFFIISMYGFTVASENDYFRNLMLTSVAPVTTVLVSINVLLFVLKRTIPSLTPPLVRYGYLRLDIMAETRSIVTALTPPFSIFLASFSHRDAMHIFMNAFALYNLGAVIERIYGGGSILELYSVCSSTGVIGSLVLQRHHLPSLGASAVAFGMLSFLSETKADIVMSPLGLPMIQFNIQTVTLGSLAFTMFGVARGLLGKKKGGADHAGHLGGLVGGYLLAKYGGFIY